MLQACQKNLNKVDMRHKRMGGNGVATSTKLAR